MFMCLQALVWHSGSEFVCMEMGESVCELTSVWSEQVRACMWSLCEKFMFL